jgi:hypothetical protein
MKQKAIDPDRVLNVETLLCGVKTGKTIVNTTDKFMKKLTSAALLVVGAILVSQSAKAQVTPNDLYMGFQNAAGGGSADYIIDLGSASGIVNASSSVFFNSEFSLASFNTVLGASSSMFGGVVGGSNAGNPSDIFLTQLRAGGAGSASTPGSSVSQVAFKTDDNTAYSDMSALNVVSGAGTLDSTRSWENDIEAQPNTETSGTLWSDTGLNPDSAVSTSSVTYEDLWETSDSSSFVSSSYTYLGYFTIDMTGSSPDVFFTPQSVPEPGTALIAGMSGLSVLLLRRRFAKNA